MKTTNIFSEIPAQLPAELFNTLWQTDKLRIERIVSHGHCTADGEWYEQQWDEWVLLLAGQARLRYADSDALIELKVGDYLLIPAGVKHRVEWTALEPQTIWLAVHVYD